MKRQIFIMLGVLLGILSLAVTAKATDVFRITTVESTESVCQDTDVAPLTDNFVFGSDYLNDDTPAKAARFFFNKEKGAFRAGYCEDTSWDNGNVGNYSFAEGHDTRASGSASHAEGDQTEATGRHAHAEGDNSLAGGENSHAEGQGTVAGDLASHAEGYYTNAGKYSHAEGYYTTAVGDASHAEGSRSYAIRYGQHAHASGKFSSEGDAQYSQLIARKRTDSATTDTLFIDGSSLHAVVPEHTTWAFQIFVVARQTSTSAGYKFEGVIKRAGLNTTAFVGNVTKTVLAEDQSDWDANIEANNYVDALVIRVKGADYTIWWVATINLTEVGG
ncbi:MAG: hypothetical protein V2A65_08665 [Candidatus Omnitrophota bacterium]